MKLKIKLRLHNTLCDFRKSQYGNWIDLRASKTVILNGPGMSYAQGRVNHLVVHSTAVGLGISTKLPKWYRAEIKPRSSLYKNYGCIMVNSIGEVEDNYSDEWFIHLAKLTGDCTYNKIAVGNRIAQMQISLKPQAPWYWKLIDLFVTGFKYEIVDIIHPVRAGHGSTGVE